MLKRLFPHPWLTVVLLIGWLLLANDVSPGNVLLGAVLGCAISFFVGEGLWLAPVRFGHPWLLLRLAAHVLIDIVVANVQVALLVLGPTRRLRPAFIHVPLDSTHEIALTALIGIVSLSPGTLCAELSDDRTQLMVHVLDLDDEAELVALIKTRYEAPLMEIFTC
ncbi:Na+/H+ antiporter subunit E [Paraburkholderia caballeronis]|uniref:Multisubunit potassium/proton antiporter, PhaE subunit n=1 Tax=Paraburkholderia caballeronis TaxID=416943 RepID=A0A1H7QDX9_9BURK|nr:Na+/H+ antiporter subunit E [Paraburkholderia caballeronis]PXW16410.1 multisubunit potassium/proton antiporter PhaE subunit [Paraburkholderia caballeronis]PXW94087.1 multisubunit potassium/proton antiporter PhaE subunit [Paraburkholderia caballeronis]RAJ89151.1 multisubunit potassium/proton antiporter PhaE subunit [Paraburkholderia caballeronis]TDV14941.1 multisubunit potassium/proton antiporter PhaE subunit [Paraburkholderia caballeronis]TDV16935.1 multisubunit potassium/proton antiporter 